jgi:hypothetical protein
VPRHLSLNMRLWSHRYTQNPQKTYTKKIYYSETCLRKKGEPDPHSGGTTVQPQRQCEVWLLRAGLTRQPNLQIWGLQVQIQLQAVVEIHVRENMELDVWSHPEKSFRITVIVTRRQILLCGIPTSLQGCGSVFIFYGSGSGSRV